MYALEGVRLIDFGQYLAGPFGPMLIGDLGADVIKVEPVTGDGMRQAGKPFFGCQRGKRDIALNIKEPEGLEIAYELVRRADAVHHNMTKGTAIRLKLGYEDCKALKDDIVYCNTYAYGREGPQSASGGLDPLYQASAGLEYEAGPLREGNPPLYLRFGMTDTSNAMLSAVGVLAALLHQRRTGEGQELWTSLLDGGAVFASDAHLIGGEPAWRARLDKGQHGLGACYRLYRTQDDAWIQIAAVKDAHWSALCRVVGAPELADDERFATREARRDNRAELEAILEGCFRTRIAWQWHNMLDDAGVPNELPLDAQQGDVMLWDADNVALGLTAEYEHPLMGTVRQFGHTVTFSETPGKADAPPPIVGQHTREILEWLDVPSARIADLHERAIVYVPDVDDDYVEYRKRWRW